MVTEVYVSTAELLTATLFYVIGVFVVQWWVHHGLLIDDRVIYLPGLWAVCLCMCM